MFPTKARNKIPKSLTYPLKAKTISEALADVPQADDFQLWFSNGYTPTELRRLTRFRLVQVQYTHREVDQFTSHCIEELDSNDPRWSIDVYAIPVEIRARVTQLLQEEALPKIWTWLLAKADVEKQKRCRIKFFYNQPDDQIETTKHEI